MSSQQQQQQQQQQEAKPATNRGQQHGPQWREAVAGACAGAFSRTVMAPVERVKLLLQLQGSLNDSRSSRSRTKQSAWQVARTVHREQGVLAFWRGNLPNVLRVSGTAAVNFTCMDYYKRAVVVPLLESSILQRHHSNNTTTGAQVVVLQRRRKFLGSLMAGGLAGATSTTVMYPLEFVRTRLAMDGGSSSGTRSYHGMWHAWRTIYTTDGILGFYQGYGIAVTGGIVFRVLYLGGYDAVKGELLYYRRLQRDESSSSLSSSSSTNLSWGERIIVAQVISLTAGTLSYPFDSVRRRLMMQAGQPVEQRKYRNSIHCIRSILQTEGIRGFFLGLGPNLVRSIGGALLLVGYDRVRSLL